MTKKKKADDGAFWVSNLSNMNVSIGDLFLTIPAYRIVNLLDSRHYHLTKEQLKKSAESGSLFKKRDKLKIRQVAPKPIKKSRIEVSKLTRFIAKSKLRSNIKIEEEVYEELIVDDTKLIDELTEE